MARCAAGLRHGGGFVNTAEICTTSLAAAIALIALVFALTDVQVNVSLRIGKRNAPKGSTPPGVAS